MFAATQDKDGIHRLSIRRIRTITGYFDEVGDRYDIRFSSRANAKICADELNEYTEYDDCFDKHTGNPIAFVDIDKINQTKYKVLTHIKEWGILTKEEQ